MPLKVDLAGSCQQLLGNMKELTKQNYTFEMGRKLGALDFLLSPGNGGIKMDLNNVQQNKKYVETKVTYKVRTATSAILTESSAVDLCDTPSEPVEKSTIARITRQVHTTPKSFTNDKMINICQDTMAFIKEYLFSDMRALREKVDERILALISAEGGVNHRFDGTNTTPGSYTDLALLNTVSGIQSPNYGNFAYIKEDYENNNLSGTAAIIGQGLVSRFFDLAQWSCCNATGVNYDAAIAKAGVAFYMDQAANSILGANRFLVVAPNVSHLLWFNKNQNIGINTEIIQHLVIPDPVYGNAIKWDLDFKWDECDKVWIYTLGAWYDVFNAIKDDAFVSPDDELNNMTGILTYRATAA